MRLKDVPLHPAYVVFHDAFDNGAMDVWPEDSITAAQEIAERNQQRLDMSGQEECGIWRAYEKLPRKKLYAFHHKVSK